MYRGAQRGAVRGTRGFSRGGGPAWGPPDTVLGEYPTPILPKKKKKMD